MALLPFAVLQQMGRQLGIYFGFKCEFLFHFRSKPQRELLFPHFTLLVVFEQAIDDAGDAVLFAGEEERVRVYRWLESGLELIQFCSSALLGLVLDDFFEA